MRRKSTMVNIDNDLYYYSSEDSEDELDRLLNKSRFNTMNSNFTTTIVGWKGLYPYENNNFYNSDDIFLSKNVSKTNIKRSRSDIGLLRLNKHKIKPKKINLLNIFTLGHNREKYLKLKDNNLIPNIHKNDNKQQKVDWKLFYDVIFRDTENNNNNFNNSATTLSELLNNKVLYEEINKFDDNIEKYRFKIITDKIKFRMKKKYELNNFGKLPENKNKIKKINKPPEIIYNSKKIENNLKNIYKIGISEIDKNRFIPMFINKLKKKYNIYLDKTKFEKRQYFQSLRKNHSYDYDYFKNDKILKKKTNKNKRIKFENVDKKLKTKYSITETKLPNFFNKNMNNHRIVMKRKNTSKNLNIYRPSERKSFIKNTTQRKSIVIKRKKDNLFTEKKTKFNISLNNNEINFNQKELNNINNKKINITDDKMELFRNNAGTIINDEILSKEFKREYPDYEEELFNLYNNFVLYEKIYDKHELTIQKNCQDYNHNINNFLSPNNKMNFPVFEKYEINDKILENAINLQNIINYLK